MSKHELIAAIRGRNVTADERFLATFDERALSRYLSRLGLVGGAGGRGSAWVRDDPCRAVVTRRRRGGK